MRSFTLTRLEVVTNQWRETAGEDEFDVELAPLFNWCATHVSPRTGDSCAHELYNTETGRTDAILEVVDNARGAKLLKLFTSPEFWAADTKEARAQIVRLHTAAFLQVIQDGITRGIGLVKIFGRSPLMLRVLQELHTLWPSEQTGWEATMQGRWLAISRGN